MLEYQTELMPGTALPSAYKTEDEPSLELIRLYEQYKRAIHAYIYRLLGCREDADDLTQEVFLNAFVSWNKLSDHNHLSAWLYRIATNLCIDLLRRRKRISWWSLTRRNSSEQQFEQDTNEDATYLPGSSGGIPEIFEREQIRLVLAGMPAHYAAILILNAAQGISYQEIARTMEISPNAAATRISRAKQMFIERYQRLNASEETMNSFSALGHQRIAQHS